MSIYEDNIELIKQIKIAKKNTFIQYINKHEPELLSWINATIEELYPNTDEPLIGKIWLLFHPEKAQIQLDIMVLPQLVAHRFQIK